MQRAQRVLRLPPFSPSSFAGASREALALRRAGRSLDKADEFYAARVEHGRARETPLPGGWVTEGVVRVVDTVRKPLPRNAEFVRRLLEHLESVGFAEAPRFRGIDEKGRQILTFVEGDVPSDCRAIIWTDPQLEAAAALLRRFHDATAGTAIAAGEDVVCHHDFGPWNLVWRDGLPVAIIDFDNAAPGSRLDDIGYAVWKHLNLGLIDLPTTEQARRLRVMTDAYGTAVGSEIIAAIERAHERMQRLIELAEPGHDDSPALEAHQRERAWFRRHANALVA